MCGLFGITGYGSGIRDLNDLVKELAVSSAERGMDATGIAYNSGGSLHIYKRAKSAEHIKFDIPKGASCVLGHTRHATQGDKHKGANNHPFYGKVGGNHFALAHNGILYNDTTLRKNLNLPKSKIETDSYIAVQLMESQKVLNADSLKYMAEKVQGSFSFSVLDKDDNIYLVKGSSPLSILHFPKQKLYAYASTAQILWKALIETHLFDDLKKGFAEEVEIKSGDILKIGQNGVLSYHKFDYDDFEDMYRWWGYSVAGGSYLDDLKMVASCYGYTSDDIDNLRLEGFSLDEIEELLYTGDLLEV